MSDFSHSQKNHDGRGKASNKEESGSNIFISHEIVDWFVPEGVKDINNGGNDHEVNLILEILPMEIFKILKVMYHNQHQDGHSMSEIVTKRKII